ncbi:MAG: UDP-N-acetylmuramoyl-L-alanine--D-glutamate ligase, partial [Leptospira sp.]|nr:UDP-N-acetylmuramoyl-L-alanine--D-glutamate ligase [Leptospira sp.]
TDGKSTTTALTHHLIKKTFPDSRMGGNIGVPFTDFCEENSKFAILELSSYQLEDSPILNPFASAILNLAPDHLERHVTMENYLAAKRKIIPTSPDHIFITSNSLMDRIFPSGFRPGCKIRSFGTEKKTDAFISPETMEIVSNQSRYSTRSFRLKGEHNLHNLAAAILLAESAGCKPADIESEISGFSGLPYRFQLIRTLNGIQFINDSKSTNLHSMLSGVKGIGADTPIILILGGRPKKEELFPLEAALKSQNAVVFLFGEAVHSWENALGEMLGGKMVVKENLEEVVSSLPATIRDNKTRLVIFSPACASFDQYKNFEERGAHFTKLISELSL